MLIAAASGGVSPYISILGIVAVVAAAIVIIFGTRSRTTMTTQDQAITALQGRLAAAQDEMNEMHAKDREKDAKISALEANVELLGNLLSSRKVIRAGFVHLGVPGPVLDQAERDARRSMS